MKAKRNGNPGKRLPGFFHILNLLPVAQMENTFWVEMESLRFIRLSSPRCSTVKIGSQREKLSLKTLIIPRVGLNFEFGSFFIYATILSFVVDFRDCDFNSQRYLLFPVLPRLCRKAKNKSEVNPNEKSSLFNQKS